MRKSAARHLKSIVRIRASIRAHRKNLCRALAQHPAAPAQPATYEPMLDLLDAALASTESQLEEAESAYQQACFQVSSLRRQRDEAATELGATQQPIRQLLVSLGPEPTIAEPAPQAAHVLARQVRQTLGDLERLERYPPSPLPGVRLDPQELARCLEPPLAALDTLCDAVIGAEAAGNAAQARADRATAGAGRAVPCVARGLVACCQLAGMDELGERIRRLARR